MLQALKTLCLIHFLHWMNSLFQSLALWGNKNWPPSVKVKKLEKFGNKSGSIGCKWSSLNAPCNENPLPHSVLGLWEFPFPIIGLWGNKNWLSIMKVKKLENFKNKMGLKCCKWSSIIAPSTENRENPFSHSVLVVRIPSFLHLRYFKRRFAPRLPVAIFVTLALRKYVGENPQPFIC